MKFPSVKELVDNGEKAAATYERNPTGSFVWIILVILGTLSIYLGYQVHRLQTQLNEMAQAGFDLAMKNAVQQSVNNVQEKALLRVKKKTDSIQNSNNKNQTDENLN